MKVLAILDTMYDWRRLTHGLVEAPRWFEINPQNHTGKRLYKLIGPGNELLVTNCCREIGINSKSHGKPDVSWLSRNLTLLQYWFDVLLICGNVALKTYEQTGMVHERVVRMIHPAARTWTKELLLQKEKEIKALLS